MLLGIYTVITRSYVNSLGLVSMAGSQTLIREEAKALY